MKQDAAILVCCHKPYECLKEENFVPIHVGKAISTISLDMIGDDTGDNISYKNNNYCELTALYWYWKNQALPKYIGLCHYRRYFLFGESIQLPDLNKVFAHYDVVLPKRCIYPFSIEDNYKIDHIPEDIEILKEVVAELYPEYREAYTHIMKRNKLSPYNMFIMKREIFSDYMTWLFSILFETEKRIHISQYPYQSRVFGFMSERLLNIFVLKNNLKVRYEKVKLLEEKKVPSAILLIKNALNNIIYALLRLRFSFSRDMLLR